MSLSYAQNKIHIYNYRLKNKEKYNSYLKGVMTYRRMAKIFRDILIN